MAESDVYFTILRATPQLNLFVKKAGIDKIAHPNAFWASGLEHAEKIGLGSRNYKLIEVMNELKIRI